MKVLLINPPIECVYSLTAGTRRFPTGLFYLAHSVRKHGIDVEVFDALNHPVDTHVIAESERTPIQRRKARMNPIFPHVLHVGASFQRCYETIRTVRPDVVGITCMFSPYCHQAYRVAEIARKAAADALVVLGGAHATTSWQHVFEHSPADAVVLGEGEEAFASFVREIAPSGRRGLSEARSCAIPGCILRREAQDLVFGPRQQFIADLDELGFPALDEVDYGRYAHVASLITSRGCPFSCSFCSVHAVVGKSHRARSVESVLEEISFYTSRGVHTFNIEDDNFTFDIHRVDAMMEKIASNGLDIELRLPNGITALKMNPERLTLFARAGVRQLFFGLESTSGAERRRLGKGFAEFEHIRQLVQMARRLGMHAFASCIVGLPGQRPEQMAMDLVQLFSNGMASAMNPYYPINGTPLHEATRELGLLLEKNLEWYEPLNFPLASADFRRLDVATAFLISLVLGQAPFARWHQRFLSRPTPTSLSEAQKTLAEILPRCDEPRDGCLLVAPVECYCEYQDLRLKHVGEDSVGNACMLSGHMLATTLELWTRARITVRQHTSRVTKDGPHCLFELQASDAPLPRMTELFLAQLASGAAQRVPVPEREQELEETLETSFVARRYAGLGY